MNDSSDSDYWLRRQQRLRSDTSGEVLEPHEIQFLERFEALGHRARWIPVDRATRRATNDFIWLDPDHEVCELKSTSAKYGAIKSRIQSTVRRAWENHGVVKDFFIVDLQEKPLRPALKKQLSQYNLRVQAGKIRRLWMMSSNGTSFEEIDLT